MCEYHLEFARFDHGGTHATEYKDPVCSNFLDHSTNPTSTRSLKRSAHRVNSSINSYGYSSELIMVDHMQYKDPVFPSILFRPTLVLNMQ